MASVDDIEAGERAAPPAPKPPRPKGRRPLRKRLKRAGRDLMRRPGFVSFVGSLIYGILRLVHASQRRVAGSSPHAQRLAAEHPAIVGLWHGQHLLAPFFRPRTLPYVALLSRNADAELNAAVVARFGIRTVRGSGGRDPRAASKKGGVGALIALTRALKDGEGVCMIADVPKGTPREAGLGIVTLARLSGRPIVPAAAVTSRRYVVKSSWDATSLPLPFGRLAVVMGDSIHVPRDADEATMEAKRREVTRAIEAANRRAAELADRA